VLSMRSGLDVSFQPLRFARYRENGLIAWGEQGRFDDSIGICLGLCDPLDSDCPDGMGCYLRANADICLPVIDDLAPGDPCSRNNECRPGSGCRDEDEICAVYCNHDEHPERPDPRCASAC